MSAYSPLASVSATREVLEAHGLAIKKSLGQHFLVNDAIVGKILDLAEVEAGDCVLEVGPGIGTLTCALLAAGTRVVSIERDTSLLPVLEETCDPWAENLCVLNMDALDVGSEALANLGSALAWSRGVPAGFNTPFAPTKFVANLPYAVAATLVLDYFQRFDSLEQATVMVQAEVADRMVAQPGTKDYGAYTVKLGLYAQPQERFKVGPGNFFPPPHVDSSVIRLNRVGGISSVGPNPTSVAVSFECAPSTGAQAGSAVQSLGGLLASLTPEERTAAATMADAAFTNRRKTLANSCKAYFASQPEITQALPTIFEQANINPTVRGETLILQDFITLGKSLALIK